MRVIGAAVPVAPRETIGRAPFFGSGDGVVMLLVLLYNKSVLPTPSLLPRLSTCMEKNRFYVRPKTRPILTSNLSNSIVCPPSTRRIDTPTHEEYIIMNSASS